MSEEREEKTDQLSVDQALWQQLHPMAGGSAGVSRRGMLASLAGAASLLGFSGTAVGRAPASQQSAGPRGQEESPWPTGWDPRRGGGVGGVEPTSSHCPPETLNETWKSEALEDGVSQLWVRPDGDDDTPVYAYGASILSGGGYIHALDPNTGGELAGEWPVETDGIPIVTTAEGEPLFVAEAEQVGTGVQLRALDPDTGVEQWDRSLPSAGIIPIILYDRDRELLHAITDGPTVRGIDTSDGSDVWSAQLGTNGSPLFPFPGDGALYLLTNDVSSTGVESGTVWAIDTGENVSNRELWSVTQDDRRIGSLGVASDGTVVAGFVEIAETPEESELLALDPADGSERWSQSTTSSDEEVYSGLIQVVDGDVYAPAARDLTSDSPERALHKFDVQSGDREWEFDVGALPTGFGYGDDRLYMSTLDGDVLAVDDDPESGGYGSQEWLESLGGEIADVGLRLGCGTLYTGPDAQGTVYALDAADGSTLDTFNVDSGILTQVSPRRGSIWVTTKQEQETPGPGTLATQNRVYRLDGDAPDEGPTASFTVDPASPDPGEDVSFDASGSTGDIVEYRWDVDGDGADDATTSDPTHVASYADPGTYEAALTVEDADGSTDSATETVTVTEPGEGPPALPGQDDPPQDLNGDGLYRDVDGSGEFTIGDIQLFFQRRNSDVVQDNAAAFNFSGTDPDEVTIGDVQALFQDFQDGVSQSDADS